MKHVNTLMFFCEELLYGGDTSLLDACQFYDSLVRHLGVVIFQVLFDAYALLFDPFLFRFFS